MARRYTLEDYEFSTITGEKPIVSEKKPRYNLSDYEFSTINRDVSETSPVEQRTYVTDQSILGDIEAGFRGALDTASFGFDDEVQAAAAILSSYLTGETPFTGFGDMWTELSSSPKYDEYAEYKRALAREHPKSWFGGSVAGAFVPVVGARGLLAKAPGLASTALGVLPSNATIGQMALAGALSGGLHGLGSGSGLEDRLSRAQSEAGLGAVMGPAASYGLGIIGSGIRNVWDKLRDPSKVAAFNIVREASKTGRLGKVEDIVSPGGIGDEVSALGQELPTLTKYVKDYSGYEDVASGLYKAKAAQPSIKSKYDIDLSKNYYPDASKQWKSDLSRIGKDMVESAQTKASREAVESIDFAGQSEFLRVLRTPSIPKNAENLSRALDTDTVYYTGTLYDKAFRNERINIKAVPGHLKESIPDNPFNSEIFKTAEANLLKDPEYRQSGFIENSIEHLHNVHTILQTMINRTSHDIYRQNLIARDRQIQQIMRDQSPLYDKTQRLFHELRSVRETIKVGASDFATADPRVISYNLRTMNDLQRIGYKAGIYENLKERITSAIESGANTMTTDHWGALRQVIGDKKTNNIFNWYNLQNERALLTRVKFSKGGVANEPDITKKSIGAVIWGVVRNAPVISIMIDLLTQAPSVDKAMALLATQKISDPSLKRELLSELRRFKAYQKLSNITKRSMYSMGRPLSAELAEDISSGYNYE